MRIVRSGRAYRNRWRVKTAGGEFENRLNLLARHMKLFNGSLYIRTCLEVFDHNRSFPSRNDPPNLQTKKTRFMGAAPGIRERGFSGAGVSRVASMPVFAYLEGMEVHFSPDVETQLQQVALANGKDAEQLVKDTVARMLENQNRFIAGVQRGIEQADRGEFVEHKDVVNRIDRLFQA
jgi:predicted transcriptional regulator